jgi:hypothetical protein
MSHSSNQKRPNGPLIRSHSRSAAPRLVVGESKMEGFPAIIFSVSNLKYSRALEIASLMLGGQKARGYCLEMICADFLAGANLDASGNADSLLLALSRIYLLLPNSQQQEFLLRIPKAS